MESKDNRAVLWGKKFDFSTVGEVSEEVILPDYYPEIRRVVSVTAVALPDSKFVSDAHLEYGGTVSFNLLYVGEDGTLSCVPHSMEYSLTQSLAQAVPSADIIISTVSENPQCRVLGPRKISLRSRLKTQFSVPFGAEYDLNITAEDTQATSSCEQLLKNVQSQFGGCAMATGSVSSGLGISGEATPILCDGEIFVKSCRAVQDRISVQGAVIAHVVYLDPAGEYTSKRVELPFEEELMAEGAREGDCCGAWGRVAAIGISTGEDELSADVEYDLEARYFRDESCSVCEDIYSTEYEAEIQKGTYEVYKSICHSKTQLTVSGEAKRSGDTEGYVFDTAAEPVFEKVECIGGKTVFSGNCKFKVYVAGEGSAEVEEYTLPMKLEIPTSVDMSASPNEIDWCAWCSVCDARARRESDKVTLSAELSIFAKANKKEKIEPVVGATLGCRRQREGDICYKIYFPDEGEGVWSIAKKYGAATHEIERINNLSKGSLCDGTPIIIK